ncbi:hypothetical protein ABPG74_003768 [Tetrahymena malaccensis]
MKILSILVIKSNYFIVFLLVYKLLVSSSTVICVSVQQKEQINFVYSPFYQYKYDITDPQGASTKIKVAQQANLIFISAGYQGVIVIDGKTNKIIFQQNADEFLFTLETTSDGEYIMMSHQAKFSIFKFVNRSSFQLMSQASFPTTIIDLFINQQQTVVYAVGLNGQLVAYDISKKQQVQQIGFYNSQSNIIHQGSISKDGNWIILGNDLLGLYVLSVIVDSQDNSQEFLLVGQGIMIWKTWAGILTDDNKYLYGLDNWNGIFICDFNQILQATPSQYPVNINFIRYWPFNAINPSVYSLKFTKNNNFLLVGVRSQGVYIFDITDRLNPVFFQGIQVGAHSFSVELSPDEKYLYYANAVSIYVFEQRPPNLNNNYPNLFNNHQIAIQQPSPAFYKWRCFTETIQGKDYFFGSFDAAGFGILDITDPYQMKQVFSNVYQASSLIDSMAISKDNRYLYVPIQENNTSFLVLDILNITNPIEVARLNMTNPNHNEAIFFSKDYKYFVSSYDNGILLIDSSQPPKLTLLCYWEILTYMTGENAGVMITNDNNYVIGAVRGYGIYVLDASVKTNLTFKSTLQTLGAEGLIPSLYNDTFAFLFDGFKGVAILDLTVLPEIKFLSRIQPLQGWSNFVLPIQNDQYLLVAQLEAGMMTLVDISNVTNPKILSSYQYLTESAQSLCLTPDQNYVFINNNLGTILLPMKSQVTIHTEIQLIQTSGDGSQSLINLQKDQSLLVGQQVQLNFVPIYPLEGMSILSVSYYSQQQIKSLPFWMNYDANNRNLLLSVDKTGLDTANISMPNLNTVLIQIAVPLFPSSFQFNYPDLQTTLGQGQLIYNYLQQQKVIDANGLITQLFDPQEPIQFQIDGINSTQRLFDLVKLTLQRGSYVNPVLFYVQSSLSLDIKNLKQPISTLSQNIQLYLQVEDKMGKFVLENFSGVIASTTDSQNQLKFEGSLVNLNRVLSQKVIFANQTAFGNINVTITLIDGVNYDVTQVNQMKDCVFIKQKQLLKKNPQLTLQEQFNRQYAGAVIDIQNQFSADFSAQSFINSELTTITYQVYILKGQEYVQITPDDWIQYQTVSGSISVYGTPPVSAFNQVFYLKINASDGYTSDFDIFYMNASGLPFIYVFNMLIKIFGPIFAIFGVYKYKSLILNSIYRNRVMFSNEIAIRGKHYQTKITVLGDDLEKSKLFFSEFILRFASDREKFAEEMDNVKNKFERFGSLYQIQQEQTPNSQQQASNMLISGNAQSDLIKKKLKQSNNSTAEQPSKDKLAVESDKLNNFGQIRRLKVMTEKPNFNEQKLKNTIQIIQMTPKYTRQTPLEREYLKKDGNVSMSRILRDMVHKNISFTLKNKKYQAKNFINDFKNADSRIFKGIKAIACRYFLKLDVRSLEVYNYLKYYAQNYLNYSKNDWYKGLVNIVATDAKDIYGFPVPFSECFLNETQINLILIDLQLNNYVGQPFESISKLDINHSLIREVLFADALGLVEQTPSIFQPCVGESIHLFSYEINSVEAFKQIKNAWCMTLRKILNFEYMGYGMSKNMTLPNWITFDHKNGVITLQGIPQSQDVEDLLIRIIDIDQYVIKQYHFKVVDEYFDTINEAGAIQGDSIMGDDLSLQISQFGNAKSNNKVINGFGSPISKPISFESQNSVLYKSKIHEEQQNYSIFKKKTGNQYDFNEVTNKNEQIPIPQKLQQDNKLSTLVFDKIESVQITDIQKQQDQEQDVIIQETGSQRENNELNQQQVNLSQNNFVKYLDSTKRDYETDRQLIQELVEQQEKGLKVDDNLITQKDKTFIENHDNSYISKQKENILYEEDQDKSQLGYSVNALNPQQSKLNNHSYFNYS